MFLLTPQDIVNIVFRYSNAKNPFPPLHLARAIKMFAPEREYKFETRNTTPVLGLGMSQDVMRVAEKEEKQVLVSEDRKLNIE